MELPQIFRAPLGLIWQADSTPPGTLLCAMALPFADVAQARIASRSCCSTCSGACRACSGTWCASWRLTWRPSWRAPRRCATTAPTMSGGWPRARPASSSATPATIPSALACAPFLLVRDHDWPIMCCAQAVSLVSWPGSASTWFNSAGGVREVHARLLSLSW